MFNPQGIIIEEFVKQLNKAYHETYSMMEPHYGNTLEWVGRLALENIANTDALYHNVDHTIMVTMVGQAILKGKHISEGGVTPKNWLHFMIAVLCHDIGYIKGVCRDDKDGSYATGVDGKIVEIPSDGTDAALTPYHVDRSQLFVRERFGGKMLVEVDVDTICNYIEMTRFPMPDNDYYKVTTGYPALVRAADFIGQLGDPHYLRKVPALFYEFEETGESKRIGYESPGHMRRNYFQFYWKVVRPYITEGLKYLQITQEGKHWIAQMNSHVFQVEHKEYRII
jgi:hypothetical protein